MHQIIIENIQLPYENKLRKIRVYLPPNYNDGEDFPVVYMHDGQNLFDINTSSYGAIWDVHIHLDHYYEETGRGIIVVGIDNYEGQNNRLNEYSPWVNSTLKISKDLDTITEDVGGLGDAYLDFLVNTLKPRIDMTYKSSTSRHDTAIIGSSMGGLISLYAVTKYPHVFSKIGAFSTAVWFAEAHLLEAINNLYTKDPIKWYLDVGSKETSNDKKDDFNILYLQGSKSVNKVIRDCRPTDPLMFVIDQGGIHNEKDWSKRFYKAIKYLFE